MLFRRTLLPPALDPVGGGNTSPQNVDTYLKNTHRHNPQECNLFSLIFPAACWHIAYYHDRRRVEMSTLRYCGCILWLKQL